MGLLDLVGMSTRDRLDVLGDLGAYTVLPTAALAERLMPRDRLDVLGDLGAYTVLPTAALAGIMILEDASGGVPDAVEPPDGPPAITQGYRADWLALQNVWKDVTLPEAFRVEWDYTSTEPEPTEGPVTLTLFEFYQGDEWVDRVRLAALAKRRKGQKLWDLRVGYGRVVQQHDGTATRWDARPRAIGGLSFEDVLAGEFTVDGGVFDFRSKRRALAQGGTAPWTFDGPVVLQVGHEDVKPGGEGKGDEPFRDGSGVVKIFDLTGEPEPGPVDDEDAAAAELSAAVADILEPADMRVSGDKGAGFMWIWKLFYLDDLRRSDWPWKLGQPVDWREVQKNPATYGIGTAVQMIREKAPAGKLAYLLAIRRWQGDEPTFTEAEARAAAGMPAPPILSGSAALLANASRRAEYASRELSGADVSGADGVQLAKLRRLAGEFRGISRLISEAITAAKRPGVDP